ncbi:hypothetical protein MN116_006402, partial [Schistosoma mekongi]
MSDIKDTLETVKSIHTPLNINENNIVSNENELCNELINNPSNIEDVTFYGTNEKCQIDNNYIQKNAILINFSEQSVNSSTSIMNINDKNCNLLSEKIIYSIKDDNTTDNISSINSVNKNWKNVRHTMKFVLLNKSKNKSEHDDSRRDSFMNRFSTQRRGTYTHEYDNTNETQLHSYQPSFRINNNINAQTNDCIQQNDALFESWFNQQSEIDEKQHEIEYLIKSFKQNSNV